MRRRNKQAGQKTDSDAADLWLSESGNEDQFVQHWLGLWSRLVWPRHDLKHDHEIKLHDLGVRVNLAAHSTGTYR